jgi:serine protease Do
MITKARVWLLLCLFGIFALMGQNVIAQSGGVPILKQIQTELAAIAQRVEPSVVKVISTKIEKEGAGNPFEQQLRDLFGPGMQIPQMPQRMEGVGSGFIISEDGTILTNNHVVAGMDKVEVYLSDDSHFVAKVLGSDPETEVAVIKIDPQGKKLQPIELGNSDELKVGYFVMAVGSPMNLDQTVTFGIVSALKRAVGITAFENYIQTDAAINRGNSGGPLVDLDGKVVGINTAIISSSGGSEGVGLAIPINDARKIADVLKTSGKITRGYLGLKGHDLTAQTKDLTEQLGTGDETGLVVTDVEAGKPADKAGLKATDAIIRVNGEKIKDFNDFRNRIAAMQPGQKAKLEIIRNGKHQKIEVELGDRAKDMDESQRTLNKAGNPNEPNPSEQLDLGFSVRPLTPQLAEKMGATGKAGLLVTEVKPASEAYNQGLRANMLITQVNGQKVDSVAKLKTAVADGKSKKSVMLLVENPTGTDLILIPKE